MTPKMRHSIIKKVLKHIKHFEFTNAELKALEGGLKRGTHILGNQIVLKFVPPSVLEAVEDILFQTIGAIEGEIADRDL